MSPGPELTQVSMMLLMDDYHCPYARLQYVEPHKALYMSTRDPCTIKCDLKTVFTEGGRWQRVSAGIALIHRRLGCGEFA